MGALRMCREIPELIARDTLKKVDGQKDVIEQLFRQKNKICVFTNE